ncbi:hypothetical protein ZWY2020_025779 [Hordeum vulgare]|nr:hypothetical protein ZWY2020_025779 [Hordeum vulgare]
MKDNNIFKDLTEISKEGTTFATVRSIRDSFLKRIGNKHQIYNFCKELSTKLSHSLFNWEMICAILEVLFSCRNELSHYAESACDLLLLVATVFPSLFRGSEEYLLKLFSEDSVLINEKSLQMLAYLAKSPCNLSINFSSDVYLLLEQKCIEGTRAESKYAISAIASLIQSPDDKKFAKLCKKVVVGLHDNHNIPTLLQSLGLILSILLPCIHHMTHQFINFVQRFVSTRTVTTNENSACSFSCKLKVNLLSQRLVKSCLPTTTARDLIENFLKMLENDKPYLRLAAGKSVLRLATRWDSHISPELFRTALLMARSLRYLTEVLKEQRGVSVHQNKTSNDSIVEHPSYAVLFLIHTLAYDEEFPFNFCEEETGSADFWSPLLVMLRELVEIEDLSQTKHGSATSSVSILLCIFRAVQKAEDVIDSDITYKLHILSKIGLLMVKELDKHCKTSDSPRHIPLPSSYYRLSRSERKADECCQLDLITDTFVKRILKEDTTCSTITERVSKESAPKRQTRSSSNKPLFGQFVSGHEQGKTKKSSVQAKDVPRKNYLDILDKDNVSSCGSAGTKLSSPGSLGLTNDFGGCDGNFVKALSPATKQASHLHGCLKKKSKRALDLRNAKNSAGSAMDTTDNVR